MEALTPAQIPSELGGESSAPKERSFVTELGWEESEWTALGGGHNGANFNNVPKKS